MGKMVVRQGIDRPPSEVFARATDIHAWPDDLTGVKSVEVLTEGEVGVGTRFRETRVMFGKEATEEMEFTAYEPGASYVVSGESCGSHYSTEIRFDPDSRDGTLLTMEMSIRPVTFGAKLMSPLGFVFAGMMRKCIEKDLLDLKTALETADEAAVAV